MPKTTSIPVVAQSGEGMQAGQTAICSLGEDHLLYRGYEIQDLIDHATYSEVAHLLLVGHKPSKQELASFRAELVELRPLPDNVKALLRSVVLDGDPMDVLRTTISYMGQLDKTIDPNNTAATLRIAKMLVARIPTIIGFIHALRDGRDPVEPNPELDHPANLLWCLTGEKPSDVFARVLDISLILYAEHGFNASTFSSLVVAGTRSDPYSAVCASLGALKGTLHGGANAASVEMLMEIGSPAHVDQFLEERLARHETIAGFGHRVLKNGDLRAPLLLSWGRQIAERVGPEALRWFEIADHVQEIMLKRKGLHANADLACGLTYSVMGIPPAMFTPIFAAGHVGGWCAHIMEQHASNRLIRPLSHYMGEPVRQWNGD
jgi:2-methylcitrate synthase